jgi:WD40 repeat protein
MRINSERWEQIKELFERAAECDPRRREGLLEEACCGDSDLRKRVEALLASDERAGSFLIEAPRISAGAMSERAARIDSLFRGALERDPNERAAFVLTACEGDASNDDTAKLWDVATRRELATIRAGAVVWCLAFSPDGKTLAATARGVRLYNVATRQLVASFKPVQGIIERLAFSPDGRT